MIKCTVKVNSSRCSVFVGAIISNVKLKIVYRKLALIGFSFLFVPSALLMLS